METPIWLSFNLLCKIGGGEGIYVFLGPETPDRRQTSVYELETGTNLSLAADVMAFARHP
jgi:hypothetical protein